MLGSIISSPAFVTRQGATGRTPDNRKHSLQFWQAAMVYQDLRVYDAHVINRSQELPVLGVLRLTARAYGLQPLVILG